MLVGRIHDSSHPVSLWIYVSTLCLLYGVSALYHRPNWRKKAREWFRRLDHAMIYLFIAGTVTPLATSTLDGDSRNSLLILMWGSAVLGCLQSLFWIHAPKALCAAFYAAIGAMASTYFPEIGASLGGSEMGLLFGGGVAYALGGLVYAIKRPNPLPRSFGYHEIFHLFVVGGSFCHFLLIQKIIIKT
jgi:hemolysin III